MSNLMFSQQISDLFIADAIASETTAATFKASASAKEVAILKASGQAVPTTKEDVIFTGKDINGRVKYSAIVSGGDGIKSVHKTSPTVAVPGYSYFTPDVTGAAAGDLVEVFMKIIGGQGNQSVDNWVSETLMYTFVASDTALLVANGIARAAHADLSSNYWYNNPPQVVYNIAGFTKIIATEALVISGKAALTDTTLIYVIENNAAYTVADKTASTFATICTLKTDWSTEIAAETAEYVNEIKYYDYVHTTAGVTYVVNKTASARPEIFDGRVNPVYVGAVIKDASNDYEQLLEWSATRVGEVVNLTSGIAIQQLEKFVDFDQRGKGQYDWTEFVFNPSAVAATDYYTVEVGFVPYNGARNMSGNELETTLVIACAVEANADTLVTAFQLARDGA